MIVVPSGPLSSLQLGEIVRRDHIRQKILAQGWQVVGTSSEGLRRRIAIDTAAMTDVIRRHHIRP